MQALNPDTQAILLLTAYFGKPVGSEPKPLTSTEWGRFALWLKEQEIRPGELLIRNPAECLPGWHDAKIPVERIQTLLGRGAALGVAVEKWQRAGIWIMTRSDPDYPKQLKQRLGNQSPAVFFGCGNRRLLNAQGIAVVGSRKATEEDTAFARMFGEKVAASGFAIVSGGARGIDEAAMLGALGADGTVVGVLADSLLKSAVSQKYRSAIRQQNLVLVSPFHPEAGFNAGNAMARNKYIYCLSGAAVVVHSGKSGGTWNGAIEDLNKCWAPLWVKPSDDPEAGNGELVKQGAQWLPEHILERDMGNLLVGKDFPRAALEDRFSQDPIREPQLPAREPADNANGAAEIARRQAESSTPIPGPAVNGSLYEIFLLKLEKLLDGQARKPKELEELLGLTSGQLKIWLNQAIEEGYIVKRPSAGRYELARDHDVGQLSMFDES